MASARLEALAGSASELLMAVGPIRRGAERRQIVLGAAALLFLVTLVGRELMIKDRGVVVGLLFVIPVALVGLELGIRAGITAALVTLAVVAIHPSSHSPAFDALGLATRGTALLAVGVLAGRFSDRMRAVHSQQHQLLQSGLQLAHLGEPQRLAQVLAEQVYHMPGIAHVRVELAGNQPVSLGKPTAKLLRLPIASRAHHFGVLEVSAYVEQPLRHERRVMLATLALQAAIAAENHRLLAMERERVALQTDLHCMRLRLQHQFRNAGHILDVHEQERLGIAQQLHEQAAQAMAASLLVVGRLERDIVDELTLEQLDKARHSVSECICELRRLAADLHSPVLRELGLLPALDRLVERELIEGGRSVALCADGLPDRLPADAETLAYRVIEETVAALEGPLTVQIGVGADASALQIRVDGQAAETYPADRLEQTLTTPRARLEMVGGSLASSYSGDSVAVTAELPLAISLVPVVDGVEHALSGELPLHDALRHAHPSIG